MKRLKTNILIILGNGFDLDLGLKTSYRDFWNERSANLTSFRYPLSSTELLYSRLEEHHKQMIANNWYDFEEIIRDYASETIERHESPRNALSRTASYHGHNLNANIEYFKCLKKEIIDYISIQQNTPHICAQSSAASLLRMITRKRLFSTYTCYNFNYTDINVFSKQLGYRSDILVKYIHGNLKDANIILGVGNDTLVGGYDFLLKDNQGAKGMSFQEDLLKADEIIIFGLAFGRNDIHYFIDLFKNIQNGITQPKITIYTYNEQEKRMIRDRLAKYNIDLSVIINKTNLKMIPTHE